MKLLDLKNYLTTPWKRSLYAAVERPIERMFGFRKINDLYLQSRLRTEVDPKVSLFRTALDLLDVEYEISDSDFARIPADGPVITVSNHPFGGLDAIIVADIVTTRRPDSKMLANYLLAQIPEAVPFLIQVNPFGGDRAKRSNFAGLRESLLWLGGGHCLGTFPSGEVASLNLRERAIVDPPWSPNVASLAEKSDAKVVPIFIEGRNSLCFQLFGLIHPMLRTLMLPRELVNKRSGRIRVIVGKPISSEVLRRMDTAQARVDYLRMRTQLLAQRAHRTVVDPHSVELPIHIANAAAIADRDATSEELQAELDHLPDSCLLFEDREFGVFIARGSEIPKLLKEIGRLREVTFREVGEGTGNAADLEPYDDYYQHIFAWDRKAGELVGAYRVGLTDEILPTRGPSGLYTSTLFQFEPEFLDHLGSAAEMGRSFVTSQYQRKHGSLALLWKGILQFVAFRKPECKVLFGPVSISQEYNAISRNLIVQYLRHRVLQPEISMFVKPRNPFKSPKILGLSGDSISRELKSVQDISALISEIEEDGKGVPTLLKHYLKLNATVLSFNVDPQFSDVLDGLIVVDATRTDPKLLKLYMTTEGCERFLRFHGIEPPER